MRASQRYRYGVRAGQNWGSGRGAFLVGGGGGWAGKVCMTTTILEISGLPPSHLHPLTSNIGQLAVGGGGSCERGRLPHVTNESWGQARDVRWWWTLPEPGRNVGGRSAAREKDEREKKPPAVQIRVACIPSE